MTAATLAGVTAAAIAGSAEAQQATTVPAAAQYIVAPAYRANLATTATSLASSIESEDLSFLTSQLSTYSSNYSNGVWSDPVQDGCWACDQGGPTTALATAYVLGGAKNSTLLNTAITSVNSAIANHQQSDGSFTVDYNDGLSTQMETMFYGVELGTTDLLLKQYVSAATQASWANALKAAANYEISSGATTYYANGNVNLGLTELLWLAWDATKLASLQTAYNNSWSFIVNPSQTSFPGCGWVTVRAPTTSTGANGTGYFAETGAGGTGYDPYYTMIQLDVLSRLYLLSGDTRALYYTNMELNQEAPLVNQSTWILDTSSGTRHTETGTTEDFQTSALAVLGLLGGRTDLLSSIVPELQQELTWYANTTAAQQPALRRGFGNSVATVALAAALAQEQASARTGVASFAVTRLPAAKPAPKRVKAKVAVRRNVKRHAARRHGR